MPIKFSVPVASLLASVEELLRSPVLGWMIIQVFSGLGCYVPPPLVASSYAKAFPSYQCSTKKKKKGCREKTRCRLEAHS